MDQEIKLSINHTLGFFTSNLFRAKVTALTTMGEAIGTKMRGKEVGGRRIRKLTKVRSKVRPGVFRFFSTPEQLVGLQVCVKNS